MTDKDKLISDAFQLFMTESPEHAQAWMEVTRRLADASALDTKTQVLAYLAVLAALRLESGLPFHVVHAREAGASREEVISAILVGLPAAGNVVTQALPAAIQAYDAW
ncbi:MAG TPA: carboxymuconolactone decarboxylase family protein [Candidatus Polarisedimenticolaceae bacterium]|nr:carboxymuconolactone decarboxylase family protein [Candidatus Polarisedimenticolaceae bacterium]